MSELKVKAKGGMPAWALLYGSMGYKASELDIAAIEKKAAEDPTFEESCLKAIKVVAAYQKQMAPYLRAQRHYFLTLPFISNEQAKEQKAELSRLWHECRSTVPPTR